MQQQSDATQLDSQLLRGEAVADDKTLQDQSTVDQPHHTSLKHRQELRASWIESHL